MPRVETKLANRGGTKEKRCEANPCRMTDAKGEPDRLVRAGQRYHTWSFRYAGTHYMHADCGYPKPSQLTNSKMSTVLSAVESAEAEINAIDNVEELPSPEDVLGPVAEAAREVAEEYRESGEAMGAAGSEMEEHADELEAFADDLESFSLSMDDWAPEETTDPDAKRQEALEEAEAERRESYVEDYKSELSDALSECPSF
jgi:hypothetical protein